jgi:hypothetical protein
MREFEELRNESYENSKIYNVKMKIFLNKWFLRKTFEPNEKSVLV